MTTHTITYFAEMLKIIAEIDCPQIEKLADELVELRGRGGRLFLAGLGGSAANASHAANDFRKLAGIDAICLSDNVAELTARANDEGWETIYSGIMNASGANNTDALMILSVGGGTAMVSKPLACVLTYAKANNIVVLGIVGKDGGYTKKYGQCVIVIPTVAYDRVTPHTEAFQSVVLHCLVSHPKLQVNATKW